MNKPFKCPNCTADFWFKEFLDAHKLMYHSGPKSSDAPLLGYGCNCGAAFKKGSDYIKHAKTCKKTLLCNVIDKITEDSHKEAPMANTLTPTMDNNKMAAAKKQRDKLRNSIRTDITKFCLKYGVKEFEAAHAIMDTILDAIDTSAKNYGGAIMPNNLAQTLLPSTQVLMGNLPEHVKQGPSPAWAAGPLFGKPTPMKAPIPFKKNSAFGGVLKPDTAITSDDLLSTEMVYVYTTYTDAKQAQKEMTSVAEATNGTFFYLIGKTYMSAWDSTKKDKYPELKPGYNYVVIRMLKTAPYISHSMLKTFDVSAPNGMKWRKLKNKPIYKLMKDPKQSAYWTKVEKAAAKAAPTVVAPIKEVSAEANSLANTAAHTVKTVPATDDNGYKYSLIPGIEYSSYLANKVSPPQGYKWDYHAAKNKYSLVLIESSPTWDPANF